MQLGGGFKMSREEIAEMVLEGINKDNAYVIIWGDTFDNDYFPQYIKKGEDIEGEITKKLANNLKVMEIYNYNLCLLEQLQERRSFHKEKIIATDYSGIPNIFMSSNLSKAIAKARTYYEGKYRKDKITPYITHPFRVAALAAEYLLKEGTKKIEELEAIDNILIASIFHDVLEEYKIMPFSIIYEFPSWVSDSVFNLTNDKGEILKIGKTEYLQAKLLNLTDDDLFIKLCDRQANIEDLANCNDESFMARYLEETFSILQYLISNRKLNKRELIIADNIFNIMNNTYEITNNPQKLNKIY